MSALDKLEERYEQLSKRLATTRERAEQAGKDWLHTAETGAAGGVLGFMEGRGTSVSIFGLDTDEVATLGLLGGSMLVDDRDFAAHLRALGAGSLAVVLNKKGVSLGEQSRQQNNNNTAGGGTASDTGGADAGAENNGAP